MTDIHDTSAQTPSQTPSQIPSQPRTPPRNSAGDQVRSMVGGMLPRLIGGALVIALAYGGYWYFTVHKNSQAVDASLPAAGKCFSWADADGAKVLGCSDPAAMYKSEGSARVGTDPTAANPACDKVGAYVLFSITSYAKNNSAQGVICGALNVKADDCVEMTLLGDASIIPCADASGSEDSRVLSIKPVASTADALSDSVAMRTCGAKATSYLSDTAGKAIVCLGAVA